MSYDRYDMIHAFFLGVVTMVIVVLVVMLMLTTGANAQDRGPHPTGVDPYAQTHSFPSTLHPVGLNCCHGTDCTPWDGDPPIPETRAGVPGWKMGKWWFSEDQRIDPKSLPFEERGRAHICVGEYNSSDGNWDTPRCFYYPYSG